MSSIMPGRLEFMWPAFQVMSFNCDIWWLSVFEVIFEVWILCGGSELGWYPKTGRAHLVSSCRTLWGICGSSFFKVFVLTSSPLAILVLICV